MSQSNLLFRCVAVLCAASIATQAYPNEQVYRWLDASGNVFYSDRVPPQHSKFGRTRLNKEGMPVEVIEKAKTEEELERESKLKELRAAEQKLLEEHLARDRTLLRSFANEQELEENFKDQLHTLETLETVNLANISRLESLLDAQEKTAAEFERNGKKISDALQDTILSYQNQIVAEQDKIRVIESQKLELHQQFASNLERFRSLTQLNSKDARGIGETSNLSSIGPAHDSIILSVAYCMDEASCNKAWGIAKNYLIRNSNSEIRIDTDRFVYAHAPENDQEIALSLARIQHKDSPGAQLFLDVRCRQSNIGKELCSSEKVRGILIGFAPYVEAGMQQVAQ